MEPYFLNTIFTFALGLILGSFANVCIYRIPEGKSIVSPASSCPGCGESIRFYDNIPLLSYLVLAGKCRHCGRRISWQYPIVEFLVGLISLGLFLRFGLGLDYLLFLLFSLALIIMSIIDLRHRIIPDLISIPGIAAGIAASFFLDDISWLSSLVGAGAGGCALFLVGLVFEMITGKEGMGGGDVKLLAMIGAWTGWKSLPLIVLLSSFTGAFIGIVFILLSGKGFRFRIPFGPFLSLGALVYLFFGPVITEWYVNLLVL